MLISGCPPDRRVEYCGTEFEDDMDLQIANHGLRAAAMHVADAVRSAGGRTLAVGGSVRDALLGLEIRDLDLEVYGIEPDRLRSLIELQFEVDLVGESFAVLKVKGLDLDISLPRRDAKHGTGHRGFLVEADPHLDPREAASRRDFTVNAISVDILTGELFDFFGGIRDLADRVLRHVSDAFAEDPLRVLRGMQLAARLDASLHPHTATLGRSLSADDLPSERILDEWKKLLLRGAKPSRGLDVLEATGWITAFPELDALRGCPQDPEWHPEGDVFVHTGHVLDHFATERVGDEWEDLVVGFSCLAHDFGKPSTTEFVDDRWRSHDHEAAGVDPTVAFLDRMGAPTALRDQVVPLVRDHLAPALLHRGGAGPAAVRRLAVRVGRIDRLVRVARSDQAGRPPKPWDGFPAGQWLLDMAADLDVTDDRPQPIVAGRHLIAQLRLEPGPDFGPLLRAAYEAQIDGRISTLAEGLALIQSLLKQPSGP